MQRLSAPENPEARARRFVAEARKKVSDSTTTLPVLKAEVAKLAEAVEFLLNKSQ